MDLLGLINIISAGGETPNVPNTARVGGSNHKRELRLSEGPVEDETAKRFEYLL